MNDDEYGCTGTLLLVVGAVLLIWVFIEIIGFSL